MNDVASDKSAKFRAQCDELVRSGRASEASIAHLRQLGKMLVDATEGGLKRVSVEDCKRRRDECWSAETGSEKTVEEGRHWQECELHMRIGKMLLEVAGNLVYIHPDTQEVYEVMVADFAPEKVLADASETGERATKEQETVHATCWRGPFIAACGADKPNQQTTTVDSHVTCPECKPLVLADKILAAWLKDAEEEPNNLKRRLRESHFRTGAYAEAFCEVGRSIPPRWLLDWVGDVAFLQELMNLWDAPPPNDVVFDHGWGGEERRRVLAILADMVGDYRITGRACGSPDGGQTHLRRGTRMEKIEDCKCQVCGGAADALIRQYSPTPGWVLTEAYCRRHDPNGETARRAALVQEMAARMGVSLWGE